MVNRAIEKARLRAKKMQQLLYDGICTIYEYQKIVDQVTRETKSDNIPVYTNIPCRVSFSSNVPTTDKTQQTADDLKQIIKLFITPDIVIKAGSKIDITQNNVSTSYKNSGQPAVYATHQEINLDLYKEHP